MPIVAQSWKKEKFQNEFYSLKNNEKPRHCTKNQDDRQAVSAHKTVS